jgi:hypothetical protein
MQEPAFTFDVCHEFGKFTKPRQNPLITSPLLWLVAHLRGLLPGYVRKDGPGATASQIDASILEKDR